MRSFARISCIILSAGHSGRMGMHKALLRFGKQDITFLEKIALSYLEAGISEVVVVVGRDLDEIVRQNHIELPVNVRFVVNEHPEFGRFYSLATGLNHIQEGNSAFFQSIDNPFVDPDLLAEMSLVLGKGEVVSPVYRGKAGHPVLISHNVSKAVVDKINSGLRIDHFLATFNKIHILTENQNILVNINSPEDYAQAFPE